MLLSSSGPKSSSSSKLYTFSILEKKIQRAKEQTTKNIEKESNQNIYNFLKFQLLLLLLLYFDRKWQRRNKKQQQTAWLSTKMSDKDDVDDETFITGWKTSNIQ